MMTSIQGGNVQDKIEESVSEMPKKRYSEPNLRVYGNIQDLTRTSTTTGGNNDTRGPAMDTRTH